MQSFTDPPERLLRYRSWSLRTRIGERCERKVLAGRGEGKSLFAQLEGIEDRTAAGALVGASIEVARSALPALAKGQFYRVDLIGLAVRNEEGVELGVLAHFVETPAHAVMVVRGDRERWIPATPQHIRHVDLQGGWMRVDWPAQED